MAQNINVDVTPNLFQPTLYYHQGDIGRAFTITISTKDGYTIPSGATVKIEATKPSGLGFSVSGTLSGNVVSFVSTEGMTDEYGRFPAQLKITSGNDILYTANFLMVGAINTHPASVTDGTAEQVISEITLLVERAETAASTAATDAANAAQARVDEMMDYLPSEVADLKSDFNSNLQFNIWDEVTESGVLNDTTGQPSSNSSRFRTKNYIPVEGGKDYYFHTNGYVIVGFAYDSSHTAISSFGGSHAYKEIKDEIVTMPSTAKYVKFYSSTAYGATYNNDICINVSQNNYDAKYHNGMYVAHEAVTEIYQDVLGNNADINALSEDVDAIAIISEKGNLFNKNDAGNVGGGYYIQNDGSINLVGNSGYAYTHLIPIKNGGVYTFDTSSAYGVSRNRAFLYDADRNYIATIQGTLSGSICTVEISNSNAKYMRINTLEAWFDTLMVVEGIVYPTTYQPQIMHADLQGSFKDVFKDYASTNLFDKDDTGNTLDAWITSNGTINTLADSGYMYSYPIPVENGASYSYPVSSLFGDSKNQAFLYDKTGAYLERIDGTVTNGINVISISNSNAKYLRINLTSGLLSTLMFVKGSTYPTNYTPYKRGKQLTDGTLISDEQYSVILQKIAEAAGTVSGNPLSGKKAAYIGDSICYGYGYSGGYAKIIAEDNDMTFVNLAVSGAKLIGDIVGQLSSLPNDADFYIIEGGINDYFSNSPIGEVKNWGYTIDQTTVSGALQYICRYLSDHFMGKKFGFIFPHRMPQWGSDWDTSYRPIMKQALEKWGVPYLDLTEKTLPIAMDNTYKTTYTDNADGIHPNEAGYKQLYVPKITAWMKTL